MNQQGPFLAIDESRVPLLAIDESKGPLLAMLTGENGIISFSYTLLEVCKLTRRNGFSFQNWANSKK